VQVTGDASFKVKSSPAFPALVRELVAIHGGTVDAASVLGEGTVFTVRLPVGTAHLARERIAPVSGRGDARSAPLGMGATPYVEEALRWLPPETSAHTDRQPEASGPTARILVADDNTDMRDYLSRLLSVRFQVESVGDGTALLVRIGAVREVHGRLEVRHQHTPAGRFHQTSAAARKAGQESHCDRAVCSELYGVVRSIIWPEDLTAAALKLDQLPDRAGEPIRCGLYRCQDPDIRQTERGDPRTQKLPRSG
jgi:hypothetical protein